jgi:hypothetical protein
VYLVGLHIYYKMIHGPYNVKILDIFSKSIQILYFIKIGSLVAELFHMDGRTDMAKLKVAFRNFANATKDRSC